VAYAQHLLGTHLGLGGKGITLQFRINSSDHTSHLFCRQIPSNIQFGERNESSVYELQGQKQVE
jgi:hypothetical protein